VLKINIYESINIADDGKNLDKVLGGLKL